MRNTFVKSAMFTAILMGVTGASFAATTSNLAVTATVSASCSIDASAGFGFGAYDPINTNATADLDAQGTISTTCTNGSTATITLGQGSNPGGASTDGAPVRRMLAGTTDFRTYQLYTDARRSTTWNNTVGSTVAGTGVPVSTTVFGRIPAGQNVPAASYSDTVLATIAF